MMKVEWERSGSKELHYLGEGKVDTYWVSILDVNATGGVCKLSLWFPGCGFQPVTSYEDSLKVAKAKGKQWYLSKIAASRVDHREEPRVKKTQKMRQAVQFIALNDLEDVDGDDNAAVLQVSKWLSVRTSAMIFGCLPEDIATQVVEFVRVQTRMNEEAAMIANIAS